MSIKIYTGRGDQGKTTTLSGETCRKDDDLIELNGLIDELIVAVERARILYLYTEGEEKTEWLEQDTKNLKQLNKIIEALYLLGAEISNGKTTNLTKTIDKGFVDKLEEKIDEIYRPLTAFMHFKKLSAINISEARVRTRKLERGLTATYRAKNLRQAVYQYINRLSDYFFVLSVYEELKWKKKQ